MVKKRQQKRQVPVVNGAPAPAQSAASNGTPPAPLVSLGKANGRGSKQANPPPTFKFGSDDSSTHTSFTFGQATNEPPSDDNSSKQTSQKDANSNSNKNTNDSNTDLSSYTKQHIRPLMDLNDRVNALVLEETHVNATRIVVAGDQSHGKTSLLEALSGVDLPRGEGIMTRVPLVLQLRQAPGEDEYAKIKVAVPNVLGKTTRHSQKIALHEIGQKVREYTALAAGDGKNIVDIPIELKIFRNNQDDLTLVDLPGITRVALQDQANGDGKKLEQVILKMCRKYMEPKESILLNVVSAMVDLSTSASLQLSHELDPEHSRTLVCLTKCDQHSEDGLHDKISKSIRAMNLKPQHVFAVRNRTQKENEQQLPLAQVRASEEQLLQQLTNGGRINAYQLGVKALSKYLVKVQCEEILQTLPQTRQTIKEVVSDLEEELESLGEPVGDAAACKAKAVQLIDACSNRLEGEASGRVHTHLDDHEETIEGESFELSVTIDDFQAAKENEGNNITSDSSHAGDLTFELVVYVQDSLRVFLKVCSEDDAEISKVDLSCTFYVSDDKQELKRKTIEHAYDFTESQPQYRGFEMKPSTTWTNVTGAVTITGHVFVDSIEFKEEESDVSSVGGSLLCSRLANLQDAFTSNIDTLYSNSHFFSEGFRKKLARELQGSRGGVGLPGSIAPHVPVGVLRKLRTKLPAPIAEYRAEVLEECTKTSETVIGLYVRAERHPKLHSILVECAEETFNEHASQLEQYHDKILEWEENVCSSNHYFMDTVNSVRSSVFEKEGEEKPRYLRHLTAETIAAMSNEDQKLVDTQMELFAYWKLMKKRLIDYILLSTQGDLVGTPIHKKLKSKMLETVFCRNDDELVDLMSPDSQVVKTRANVVSRLEKLNEALKEIDEYKAKHPGGLVEIE